MNKLPQKVTNQGSHRLISNHLRALSRNYRKRRAVALCLSYLRCKDSILFQTSKFYAEKLDFRILIQRKVVSLQRVL